MTKQEFLDKKGLAKFWKVVKRNTAGVYVIKIDDDNFNSTTDDLKSLNGYQDFNWRKHYPELTIGFDNATLPEFIRLELTSTDGEIMSTHVFFLLEAFHDQAVYRCNRWAATITITFSKFSITCNTTLSE